MEELVEKIVTIIQPDREKAGYLLLYTHGSIMWSLPIVFILFESLQVPMFIAYIPLYLYHLVFKRCPLTKVERRLHKQDVTVVDSALHLFGMSSTYQNRKMTLLLSSTLFVLFMVIYISMIST